MFHWLCTRIHLVTSYRDWHIKMNKIIFAMLLAALLGAVAPSSALNVVNAEARKSTSELLKENEMDELYARAVQFAVVGGMVGGALGSVLGPDEALNVGAVGGTIGGAIGGASMNSSLAHVIGGALGGNIGGALGGYLGGSLVHDTKPFLGGAVGAFLGGYGGYQAGGPLIGLGGLIGGYVLGDQLLVAEPVVAAISGGLMGGFGAGLLTYVGISSVDILTGSSGNQMRNLKG